jgi:hypothetical protein
MIPILMPTAMTTVALTPSPSTSLSLASAPHPSTTTGFGSDSVRHWCPSHPLRLSDTRASVMWLDMLCTVRPLPSCVLCSPTVCENAYKTVMRVRGMQEVTTSTIGRYTIQFVLIHFVLFLLQILIYGIYLQTIYSDRMTISWLCLFEIKHSCFLGQTK